MQDRSTGKMIGVGYESQGLYHLSTSNSPVALSSTTSADLLHNFLVHPSLAKLQKLFPNLSSLSSFECTTPALSDSCPPPSSPILVTLSTNDATPPIAI
ncbi:hypothetical protein P3X46_010592 [Hevea brasiliensis]|uniref:GAG-pre-integrase domain-containing protein n=1 Tax=Hevea brasiliensis TaxID=3981 RepID=A0ABQ9MIQ5_HEVBR|nr:hypothetical protein P3X46_010592 [Hevea brasiliensis]